MTATVQVIGLEQVQTKIAGIPAKTREALVKAVARLGVTLQRNVMEAKLSGGVLNVRTGRLRRSINLQTSEDGSTVSATVGTNVAYGRFWELGFQGVEHVRAHQRRNGHVQAHDRRVNVQARSFLRSALEEMRAQVRADLEAAARGVT